MKKFMTMSAFFLSAACLSVHTPSFAQGFFGDISLGAEKATQGLLNTGSQHHKHHRATNDAETHSHSPAYYDKQSYDTGFVDPTPSASPIIAQDPLSSTEPSTASTATPDTSPKTQQQQPYQSVPQEHGERTDTSLKNSIRPPAPQYTTQE